ncbi:TolC family protein [Agriterribacter sp.]|uniref:TolC family protein n=1 Tax=Agriterribacter sp. TaxID=2821509 RepID=UPI002CF5E193|nr:TolC family protein [Agriterribacter sp.]HTN08584.1 TolC family protein [Agriterribacter sp.]
MRKLLCYLVVFATLMANPTANAQTTIKWDLRRCVEYALTNNVSVRQADIQARLSAIALKQSKLAQIPSLNFSGNHGFQFGRSLDYTTNTYTDNNSMYQRLGLNTEVNLFNWNSQKNTIKSNDYNYQADAAAVDKAKNDIALNVARQYLLVLLDMEQAEVTGIQLKQSQAQYQNTRKQVDAGALPELSAAELEAQVARDSANLITAQTQIEVDKLALKALINLPADAGFELDIPPVEQIPVDNILEISPATIYVMATQSQPQIKVNNLRLQAAQKSYEAARGKQYPTISLFGQLGTAFNSSFKAFSEVSRGDQQTPAYILNGTDKIYVYTPQTGTVSSKKRFGQLWDGYGTQVKNNFGQGIGIGLSIPIFNGWSARANIERAKWDIKSKALVIEQDTLQLKQDVYTAFNQALGSFHTFNARQKEVSTAERSFNLASKRYDIGAMQTIEWLTNQSNLYNARINKLIAQYDYVFKMKVLEFYKGQGIRL